jgi:nucleotide-binding universal stress UspA family protein
MGKQALGGPPDCFWELDMFPYVMVVSDLSDTSSRLVRCMVGMRQMGTREIVLAYCLYLPKVGELAEATFGMLRPLLVEQQHRLEQEGFQVTIEMAVGPPGIELNRIAEQRDCSLIVLDAGKPSLMGDLLLGSPMAAVIHAARRPVLVVRMLPCDQNCEACCNALPCAPLEHILFPTDFSDNAERAFAQVEQLVAAGVRRISLLHVQDEAKLEKRLRDRLVELNRIDTARLQRLRDRLTARAACQVEIELAIGPPVREILRRSQQSGLSLIVMGSQGRGLIQEIVLGSVSGQVVREAPVSVLLVPGLR